MNAIRFIARMFVFVITFIAIDLLTGPERDLDPGSNIPSWYSPLPL